ncbi:hypothetical protein ACPFUC_001888 [Vibrio cholerae]|jgi:hypothetical protein|uniref:hypothetical protein n=1 Tax=Vibrio fluvialis TaxID=676 RepID=UPI0025744B5C|nr:hypothetical protein [Vibrio fluvialis]EGR4421464.1 hypothetical protein [Vibrio cholerae]BEI26565.1 hypothetical protein KKIDH5335_48970 [Vibrio fluvialis]
MASLARLKMLLSPREVDVNQDTACPVTTIGFRGNKGLVALSFIDEECNINGILSLDCGELSDNEANLIHGFCRQEHVEFRHC